MTKIKKKVNKNISALPDEKEDISTNSSENIIHEQVDLTDKKKRFSFSKKQVIILSVSIALVAAVFVSTILIIKYLYPFENENTGDYSTLIRKEFNYVIDINDEQGFAIDSSWLGELTYSQVDIIYSGDDGLQIDSDMRLQIMDNSEYQTPGRVGVFEFRHNGTLISKITVTTVESSIYLYSKEDLMAIPAESEATYVQMLEIDMAGGSVQIDSFSGKYFGNHNKIKNLSFSEDSRGLFKFPKNAFISSLTLENVSADYSSFASSAYFGTLADIAENTEIMYCVSTGNMKVETGDSQGIYSIGGLLGKSSCFPRTRDTDIVDEIYNCQTQVKIEVSGKGSIFVGGISGISKNITVEACYSLGEIKVEISEGLDLRGLYVGGISGRLEKEYSSASAVVALDTGQKLYSYSDINIDVRSGGDGVNIFSGGVFGSVENHGAINSGYYGEMYIRSVGWNLYAGGFSGEAVNTTIWDMSLRGITINAVIEIRSGGSVYAGGLSGSTTDVLYSDVVKAPFPTIEALFSSGDSGTREQIADQYVALSNE